MKMSKEEHSKGHSSGSVHKKVFDVTRPGKALASPTSRPIITSNKPQNPDDQFVARHMAIPDDEEQPTLKKHKKIDLKPAGTATAEGIGATAVTAQESAATAPQLDEATPPTNLAAPQHEDAAPQQADDETSSAIDTIDNVPDDASEEMAPSPDTIPSTEDAKPWEPPTETATEALAETPAAPSDSPVPDGVEQQPAAPKPAPNRPMSHDDVLAETSAPMLEHVIVSHHKAHRTKLWEWLLILILMIVVAVAAVNFLLDAEIVKTDLDIPHTNWLQ
jgi:hypothetical protein